MKLRLAIAFLIASCCHARDLTRYVVVLDDEPALRRSNRVALLRAAHAPVRNTLRARGARITSEAHTLLNAIFVEADGMSAAQLQSIEGVRYAARIPAFHMLLDRAVELINVPAAWTTFGGEANAGSGVRIAVIDSGIEASHRGFQSATLRPPANFPVCSIAKLPLVPLDCSRFTNGKVIVARSYVPLIAAGSGANPAANSRPDDYSPRDRVGHGTAVAMAAAGVHNSGPAAGITGVAPGAWLGSYKVFGSPGVNDSTSADAVLAALEDAFSDGMDVAVLSLGAAALSSPDDAGFICGNPAGQPCDPFAAAVKNAVDAGMVVVAAGGNEGLSGTSIQPTYGSVTTPAHAPAALAVGATTNSHTWSNSLTVTGLNTIRSLLGAGPAPSTNPMPLGDAGASGDSQACSPLQPGSLAGLYALVNRGTCAFIVKVQNLQSAGAAGAIIVNAESDNTLLTPGGLSGTTIPAAFIGNADGLAIRVALRANGSVRATMSAALVSTDLPATNKIAGFSSRGPVLGSGALKPDIAAPGTDLYIAGQSYDPNGALYSPAGYVIARGTSFSAPLVAGIAALVKQANRGLTAAQIKSAIVNSAATATGAQETALATGAGLANAASALSTNLAAVPSSISFGVLTPATRLPLAQNLRLTNTGKTSITVSLVVEPRTPETRAHVDVEAASYVLAPAQTLDARVTLSGTLPDPGAYEGVIAVRGGATAFRIPYLYMSSDGVPKNIIPLIGDGDDGSVSQSPSIGVILAKVVDSWGLPVPNAPVRFAATAGGGTVRNADIFTDIYGFAGANVRLGPDPGTNTFTATSGGLSTSFNMTARAAPAIAPNGVVDAASFTSKASVAPGSYIAIFGTNLSPASQTAATATLPVSMSQVSVSFDSNALSFPGRLHFVTPGQINVQVPWEFSGASSVLMKVSQASSSTAVYTVPLSPFAPGIFEYQSAGASYAAARDAQFALIGPANPARRGAVIQLYCNGLGPVTNQPASGEPSPSVPLAETTTKPIVTIGGQDAGVLFSGLAPTVVGLYQINVTIPNVTPGSQPVTVSIGGLTSKPANIVIQ